MVPQRTNRGGELGTLMKRMVNHLPRPPSSCHPHLLDNNENVMASQELTALTETAMGSLFRGAHISGGNFTINLNV